MEELARHIPIGEAIAMYNQAIATITKAYKDLEEAEKMLYDHFQTDKTYFSLRDSQGYHITSTGALETVIENLQRDFWRVLIDKMKLRSVLSIEAHKRLEEQLKYKEWPEVTKENAFLFMQSMRDHAHEYLEELVEEVYRFLRPRSSYKTNSEYKVGKKVILEHFVTCTFDRYQVSMYYHKQVQALERVFLALDGKVEDFTWGSALETAIDRSSDGTGQTDYFSFRAYKKGTLHITFTRPDLVQKFNEIAGSRMLSKKEENESS